MEDGYLGHAIINRNIGDGSSLRALLVEFDFCHLTHVADEYWSIAEIGELSGRRESAWHAQRRHQLLQIKIALGLKTWQLQIHLVTVAFHLPVAAVEGIEHVANGFVLAGQVDAHAVGTVAVGHDDGLVEVVLGIRQLNFLLVHHGHDRTVAERLFPCFVYIEGIGPDTLEVEGVQQIAHSITFECIFVEHLCNHPLGVVAGPLIDDVHGLPVGKVAVLWLCVVVVVGFLYEAVLQLEAQALVDEDGVGDECRRLLVERASLVEHLPAEGVDGVGSRITKAQHLVDLLLRLPVGSVVHHTQGVGDAQRREDAALLATRQSEQAEGEVVIAGHQLPFAVGQLNLFRKLEDGCRKMVIVGIHLPQLLEVADAVRLRLKEIVHQALPLEAHAFHADVAQAVGAAIGGDVLVTIAAKHDAAHVDGLYNRRGVREEVVVVVQAEVQQQEVLLVAAIIVHVDAALVVLA